MKQMLNGNMIVTEIKKENITASGIILDSVSTPNIKQAVVKYPDNKGITSVGDIVNLPYHSGTDMQYEGEDVLVINVDRDILFID